MILILSYFVLVLGQAGEWAWLAGPCAHNSGPVMSAPFDPGARHSPFSWSLEGDLYMYGGHIQALSRLGSDLWRFNLRSLSWTEVWPDQQPQHYGQRLVSSPENSPSARALGCSFHSKGILYMFGGHGSNDFGSLQPFIEPYFNDVWAFSLFTNEWTWITGESTVNSLGVYTGENLSPRSRFACACWGIFNEKMYLFGGSPEFAMDQGMSFFNLIFNS
jgi:N-acetylneuraminic acid mutarotase